jgi:integrase
MGGTLGPATVRHHLNTLSNLYRRAQSELRVPPGFNPVAAMMDKPMGQPGEAAWLEVHEAALLLEAARRYAEGRAGALPLIYPLLATYLLTGGRTREVLGLEVADISFKRRRVTFRVHPHRRLKTKHAARSLPLWPQLTGILQEYIFGGEAPLGTLLFPSRTGGMLHRLHKPLDAIAGRAGWKPGEIRPKMFRHTYCAARLQTGEKRVTTLEDGSERVEWIPVSTYTVTKEMGHGGTALVERVYGHLGETQHRSEVVEYRVENHQGLIGDRLGAL